MADKTSTSITPFEQQGLWLRDFFFSHRREDLNNTLSYLLNYSSVSSQSNNIEYDFNSLFIGPGKLFAAPYASVYLEQDKLLMGQSTLLMRKFMQHFGVGITENRGIPDDHISYEIEFTLLLLRQIRAEKKYKTVLKEFCNTHFNLWVPRFIECILQNARTMEIINTGLILKKWSEQSNTGEYNYEQ